VKILLIIPIFLFIFSCSATKQETIVESCPDVSFSKEHQIYFSTNQKTIDIDNIAFSAEINNYSINSQCLLINKNLEFNISILFVVNINDFSNNYLNLPYYIATINSKDELIDIEYFFYQGEINRDMQYSEIEIVEDVLFQMPNLDENDNSKNSLLIGFMLDNEKIKILN